jgi:hypothetical protein
LSGREDIMGGKALGSILAGAGVVLFVLSAFAEPLGLGDDNGVGLQQVAGMVIGGVVVAAGLALMYVRRGGAASAPTTE